MSNIICDNCLSSNLYVDMLPSGVGQLRCNDCLRGSYLSKEEAAELLKEMAADSINTRKGAGIMHAAISFDSGEARGPMTLKMLYDAVTEAMEKGMPMESEVFNSCSEKPIEGVRFLFETDRVSPIQCGEHMYGDEVNDLVIDTHECGER